MNIFNKGLYSFASVCLHTDVVFDERLDAVRIYSNVERSLGRSL